MLYAIGDPHLSLAVDKKMDVFGGVWEGYVDKLREGFQSLEDDDVVVICGDTSWAMTLPEALPDFIFLESLPGRKLLVKGNHDYWWETASKMKAFLHNNNLLSLDFLHNNAFLIGNTAICGTRGWFFEEEKGAESDRKIMLREIGRLRASLSHGRRLTADGELLVFLHYPPLYEGYRCDELVDLMGEYGVKRCFYGHLHGPSMARSIEGDYRGILYSLISADYVGFKPVPVPIRF